MEISFIDINFFYKRGSIKGQQWWLMHAIPTLWEAEAGGPPEARSLRSIQATKWDPHSPQKNKKEKNEHPWWHTSTVPATWEAEAWGSLEPGSSRLWWAMMTPLHSQTLPSPPELRLPWSLVPKELRTAALKHLNFNNNFKTSFIYQRLPNSCEPESIWVLSYFPDKIFDLNAYFFKIN